MKDQFFSHRNKLSKNAPICGSANQCGYLKECITAQCNGGFPSFYNNFSLMAESSTYIGSSITWSSNSRGVFRTMSNI